MRKIRAMIGMPVVCHGRKIGRMVAPELSEDIDRLRGIWVSGGLRGTRYIPAERLELLGTAAILSDSRGRRRRMTSAPLFRRAVSTDGQRLGAVTGAEIDELSFCVTSLELTRGLWDDLVSRRVRVSQFTANRETGEVIVNAAGDEREDSHDEGRYDEGARNWDADRIGSGDGVRRDELADGAPLEPDGEAHGQLDLR